MDGSRYQPRQNNNIPDCVSAQLLGMAIQGWALEHEHPLQGIPALPERGIFLSAFIILLHRYDWRQELHRLAMLSNDGWHLREEIRRYFTAPDIHGQLVETLAGLVR